MQPYQYQPSPQFIPLPTLFASRVRWGSVLAGTSLIVGALLFLGISAFFNNIVNHSAFPLGPLGTVAQLLPPLCVIATAIVVLTCRRALRGDYLVVSVARTTRNVLIVCYGCTILFAFLAFVVIALLHAFGGLRTPITSDMIVTFGYLALGSMGFAVGHFYVRPSQRTLQKFADRPVW
ncbi:hypothetical protein ACFWY9_23000 [Amycolatopsis sp. NPDC059027]|uniref:hypothetical protein n=1 Tax=unclassified Amycolatopsis TaxID=2618356 RepID=UPI003671CB35